jgi:hypothetical protein
MSTPWPSRAEAGRIRSSISKWPADADNSADRREWTACVAWLLFRRERFDLAEQVARAALGDPVTRTNLELAWRLSAVAEGAARIRLRRTGSGRRKRQSLLERLRQAWGRLQ